MFDLDALEDLDSRLSAVVQRSSEAQAHATAAIRFSREMRAKHLEAQAEAIQQCPHLMGLRHG